MLLDYDVIEPMNKDEMSCILCTYTSTNLYVLACGHRYCRACLMTLFHCKGSCPIEGHDSNAENAKSLIVLCIYKDRGCTMERIIKEDMHVEKFVDMLDEHIAACRFRPEIDVHMEQGSTLTDVVNVEMDDNTCDFMHCKNQCASDDIRDDTRDDGRNDRRVVTEEADENLTYMVELQSRLDEAVKTNDVLKCTLDSLLANITRVRDELNDFSNSKELNTMVEQDNQLKTHEMKINRCFYLFEVIKDHADTISRNGTLAWTIHDYSEKLRDAITNKVVFIQSHPFYTEMHGYKLRARLYPNGFGSGLSTHMSLYLQIMDSVGNDIQQWPFKHNVTFTLIDQVNHSLHLRMKLDIDPMRENFRKPEDKKDNIPFGIDEFISIRDLNDRQCRSFLRYNTICIKIEVTPPNEQANQYYCC